MLALRWTLPPVLLLLLLSSCGRSAYDLGLESDDVAETGPGECGNGVVEADEDCDGDNLDGRACTDFGFSGGELTCSDNCSFDATACTLDGGTSTSGSTGDPTGPDPTGDPTGPDPTGPDPTGDPTGPAEECGNGIIEPGEECDGADFGGINCTDLGFGPGLPLCTIDCLIDTSTCPELTHEGDPCGWGEPCPEGYACVDNTCYDGSPGDPCEGDMDCQSGDCVQMGGWGAGTCG